MASVYVKSASPGDLWMFVGLLLPETPNLNIYDVVVFAIGFVLRRVDKDKYGSWPTDRI